MPPSRKPIFTRRRAFTRNAPGPGALGLLGLLACAVMLRADDWPQWRETGIVEAIPPSGLDVRWSAKIGQGYSGPVVAQGRVFVTDHVFEPEAGRVLCFGEATGKATKP